VIPTKNPHDKNRTCPTTQKVEGVHGGNQKAGSIARSLSPDIHMKGDLQL